jgi:hypothetical protein
MRIRLIGVELAVRGMIYLHAEKLLAALEGEFRDHPLGEKAQQTVGSGPRRLNKHLPSSICSLYSATYSKDRAPWITLPHE